MFIPICKILEVVMQMVDEGQLELDQSWRSVAGGQVEATL